MLVGGGGGLVCGVWELLVVLVVVVVVVVVIDAVVGRGCCTPTTLSPTFTVLCSCETYGIEEAEAPKLGPELLLCKLLTGLPALAVSLESCT